MAAVPAIITGGANSNMPSGSMPMRAETSVTRRFVDVPMVVAIPPMMVENPIGISTSVTGICVRMQTATNTGRTIAMSGVLFMNMLAMAQPNMATSKPPRGLLLQTLASTRVIGVEPPNALGIDGFGDIDILILEEMLSGKAAAAIGESLRAQGASIEDLDEWIGRIKGSLLLSTLL